MNAITLNFSPLWELTNEQFYQLCRLNPDAKIELTARGELVIMSPTGAESGMFNSDVTYQLTAWNKQNRLGVPFDSSTGFTLPNGAVRSPDTSWVKLERWNSLTQIEKEVFAPICPDFVIELRSKTDIFKQLQAKMKEYLDNGLRLGWLIDPTQKIVEIYRQGKDVEVLHSPRVLGREYSLPRHSSATVSGEDVLPGFVLDLKGIF